MIQLAHSSNPVQGSLPLVEVLVTRSGALQASLLSTVSALSSFLDSLQTIADAASNTKGELHREMASVHCPYPRDFASIDVNASSLTKSYIYGEC